MRSLLGLIAVCAVCILVWLTSWQQPVEAPATAQVDEQRWCSTEVTSDQGISHHLTVPCDADSAAIMSAAAWAMQPGQFWNDAGNDQAIGGSDFAQPERDGALRAAGSGY